MSDYRLEKLFSPRRVALVGASPREGSLGHAILVNLRRANTVTPPLLVNPSHKLIDELACYPSLRDLPETPELVVIATPPGAVLNTVREACAIGVCAAIIITAGLGHGENSLAGQALKIARAGGLRLIGPNCIGVVSPRAALDASFLARPTQSGNLAFISQSGAIVATLVEWASDHRVGFSGMVSLGDQIDVDFADCLDHFAIDPRTDAILLYIESIGDARKFLAAARAAARVKPVIVVKAGRHQAGARAAHSHTGAMTGADAVYDAAFRRAGLLRVVDLKELFAAAETLARGARARGDRVGVVTNGGGIGVLAVDRLVDFSGAVATLSPPTLAALDHDLPNTWSRANPVDIIGDADASRYARAMKTMLASADVDAILVINCPTALVSSLDAARAVTEAVSAARAPAHGISGAEKPVFAVWFGNHEDIATQFQRAHIPCFDSEVDAVRGLMYLIDYRRSQDALMRIPPSSSEHFMPRPELARPIIASALAAGRSWLDPIEVAQVLDAYSIPNAPSRKAASRSEAEQIAQSMLANGGALAIKILSPDITHKSDVGGVRLGMRSSEAAGLAFDEMIASVKSRAPNARIEGVVMQPMIERSGAIELIAGISNDPTFGPVILFGHGGTAVEAVDDHALALPPLDLNLARDLIARTRVSRLLAGYRDVGPSDLNALAMTLIKTARLSADIPEIQEMDLNPLLVDQSGVIALDARIRVAPSPPSSHSFSNPRFAIRPYPSEWIGETLLANGRALSIRPLMPEDAGLYEEFFRHIDRNDIYRRFFMSIRHVSPAMIARLTQIDYARTMVFLAIEKSSGLMLGAVRLHTDGAHEVGEFAILVRSDAQGQGIGWTLMEKCIAFARAEGLRRINGQVLKDNIDMLTMCRELGFEIHGDADSPELKAVSLILRGPSDG